MPSAPSLPYKISVLVYIEDGAGRQLLMRRHRAPNRGLWSPVGGKLEMSAGESPHACARREAAEETGLVVGGGDLHLFAMIAERGYEGAGHWLLFCFACRRPIEGLPPPIEEGEFAFFSAAEIDGLDIPETDREALWPAYRRGRDGFVALRADCRPERPLEVQVDERF